MMSILYKCGVYLQIPEAINFLHTCKPKSTDQKTNKENPPAHLPGAQPDDEIGNEGVFSLPAPVGHHDAPARVLGELASLDGFRYGPDLVDLQQEGVTCILSDRVTYARRVCDQEVVAANGRGRFGMRGGYISVDRSLELHKAD